MRLFSRDINGWSFRVYLLKKDLYKLTVRYKKHRFVYTANNPTDLVYKAKLIIQCVPPVQENQQQQLKLL